LNVFRLSSKSHWDVPVTIGTETIHLLCSHPTPPVFDDGETLTHDVATGTAATKADWNGLRNNDEIRFWADYVDPAKDNYIYDDTEITVTGTDAAGNQLYTGVPVKQGLGLGQRFVILGDLNSDPVDGDSSFAGATSLITSAFVDATVTPQSTGALAQVPGTFNNRSTKTSSFNLRADYALPSQLGTVIAQAGVHWPLLGDATVYLLDASDHRSVWVDLSFSATQIAVNPTVAGSVGGTVTGGGTFTIGSTATFTARPAAGCALSGWKVNGSASPETSTVLNATVTDGMTVEATFAAMAPMLLGENGYTSTPLVTIGNTLVSTGALNSSSAGSFTPVGILDGIGAYSLDSDTVRVFVNQELGTTAGSNYTLANGVTLKGSRISYFDINKTTKAVEDAGLAYNKIYDRAGNLVTAASQLDQSTGLDRLCSSALIEPNQFGAGKGIADRIYFAGEELWPDLRAPCGRSTWPPVNSGPPRRWAASTGKTSLRSIPATRRTWPSSWATTVPTACRSTCMSAPRTARVTSLTATA